MPSLSSGAASGRSRTGSGGSNTPAAVGGQPCAPRSARRSRANLGWSIVTQGDGVDLLPIFSNNRRRYPSAASWRLSSEIRLSAGCASARRLLLLGFFGLALYKQRLAFMVTPEQDALDGLVRA